MSDIESLTGRPTLSIIIVNWNGVAFLPHCLRSIVENPPSVRYEIVVVDNDSSDGSVEWMRSATAKKTLGAANFTRIESKENLGFGCANNLAIEKTTSPFIFLLNPDTVLTPGAVDRLLETLQSNERIGLVGPRLLNADGTLQPSVWPYPPTAMKMLFDGLQLYRFIPSKIRGDWLLSRHWLHNETRPVKVLSGAAMMVKREMIKEIGAFDPKFHMYGEDAEWCLRINKNNWQVIFEHRAEIIHLGGQSSAQRWGSSLRLKEEEAFLQFQKDFLSPFQVMLNTAMRIVILLVQSAKNLILRRTGPSLNREIIRLQFKGFSDSCRALVAGERTNSGNLE